MNKVRTGNYLKELRKKKGWTIERLSHVLAKKGEHISSNSISEWENGSNYPSIENLELLSSIYGKSIDEILDGEDYIEIDYSKKYILTDENWTLKFDDKSNLWQIRNEETLKIVERFKNLLLIRLERELTHNEENEFKFLFNNFFELSEYANEEYINIDSSDEYVRFKTAINECLVVVRNMNEKEKYWEIIKLFSEKNNIMFKYLNDIDDINSDRNKILLLRFDNLDDWYKDMMLATFQNLDPLAVEPSNFGSMYLKRFEDNTGVQYDKEKFIKSKLRIMIKHGAKINRFFLNIKKKKTRQYRVIDKLEELYNICKKPIKVSCYDNSDGSGNTMKYYLLENNSKNRFLNEYYFQLSRIFGIDNYSNGDFSDVEYLYDFFIKNETIPEDIKIDMEKKFCQKQNYKIDYSQEERYWKADLNRFSGFIFDFYNEFRQKEKKFESYEKELKNLEDLLYSNKAYYEKEEYDEIGGKDQESIRNNIIYWKSQITYEEFLSYRDDKATKELLKELDCLSVQEIREKYFKIEVYDND